MAGRGQDIASVIKAQIEGFGGQVTMVDVGVVTESGDGCGQNVFVSGDDEFLSDLGT